MIDAEKEKVYLARVDGYGDHTAIVAAIRKGLDFLGWKPPKRIVGQPSWLWADDIFARACYTRPEVIRAACEAIFARNPDATMKLLGSRTVAARARGRSPEMRTGGALALEKLFPGKVTVEAVEAGKLCRYSLSGGTPLEDAERGRPEPEYIDARKRYWREVVTSASLADAQAFIAFPALKSSVLSHGMAAALELQGTGLLLPDDRPRGQCFHNDRRIVDLLEIAEPDLIITDAIEVALGGSRITGRGYPLGMIVMATNAVAHDATIARIMGLKPEKIDHIRIAHERGYGPIFATDIERGGDFVVGEASAIVKSFGENGFIPITELPARFKREVGMDFPLEILAEPPWDVAGDHGVVLDWLYMTYDFRERRKPMAGWIRSTIMCGAFAGKPPEPANDRVYVVGDGAIAAWRRLGYATWGFWLPGPKRWERFTRQDGRKGWAVLIPGSPPAPRMPMPGWARFWDATFGRVATALRRWWRNRGGIPTVMAGSIERLAGRKAARLLAPPPKPPAAPAPPKDPSSGRVRITPDMAPQNPHLDTKELAAVLDSQVMEKPAAPTPAEGKSTKELAAVIDSQAMSKLESGEDVAPKKQQ